ncbi:Surfeit locus protein 6 family protein [Acanthocheilonema viteae]
MLSKEDREKLLGKCIEIDKIIKRNIDLIPITNWQFDDETLEKLREQKHRIVDEHLTGEQKRKLSKASKQRLARGIGVNCQKITDVLDWMAKNCNNTKPLKPVIVSKAMRELKNTKNMKPKTSKSIDFEASDADNPTRSFAEVLKNESFVNGTACASNNGKKLPRIRDNSTSDIESSAPLAGTSTVAPADALEGRKLALKKLQEKLEQFKAKRRGKMTAYEYEEKRKLKRRMSKLKMKERRKNAKQQIKNSRLPSDEVVPKKRSKLERQSEPGKMEEKDDKLIFSKFDFIVRDEKQKKTKKDKRDKFTGKDYKRLLEKAEKREERLEQVWSKNPEKAFRIEKNIQWKKALSRAEGQKVKDNPDLLRKSLKKKEKIKEWRKKKWANRVEHTLQMQARKQEKRSANIQARKDIVKKRKLQKARKKGRIL